MPTALTTWFALGLILLAASGCSRIPVKDMVFYGDKGKFGATAVHSLRKEIPPVAIPKQEWDALRIGMVCTLGDNISYVLATIDELCAKNPNTCDYEEVAEIKEALLRIERASTLSESLEFYSSNGALNHPGEIDLREFKVAHSLCAD